MDIFTYVMCLHWLIPMCISITCCSILYFGNAQFTHLIHLTGSQVIFLSFPLIVPYIYVFLNNLV